MPKSLQTTLKIAFCFTMGKKNTNIKHPKQKILLQGLKPVAMQILRAKQRHQIDYKCSNKQINKENMDNGETDKEDEQQNHQMHTAMKAMDIDFKKFNLHRRFQPNEFKAKMEEAIDYQYIQTIKPALKKIKLKPDYEENSEKLILIFSQLLNQQECKELQLQLGKYFAYKEEKKKKKKKKKKKILSQQKTQLKLKNQIKVFKNIKNLLFKEKNSAVLIKFVFYLLKHCNLGKLIQNMAKGIGNKQKSQQQDDNHKQQQTYDIQNTANKTPIFQQIIQTASILNLKQEYLINRNEQKHIFHEQWVYGYGMPYSVTSQQMGHLIKFVDSRYGKVIDSVVFPYIRFYNPQINQVVISRKKVNRKGGMKNISMDKSSFFLRFKDKDIRDKLLIPELRLHGLNYRTFRSVRFADPIIKKDIHLSMFPYACQSNDLIECINKMLMKVEIQIKSMPNCILENAKVSIEFHSFYDCFQAIKILQGMVFQNTPLKVQLQYGGGRVMNNQFRSQNDYEKSINFLSQVKTAKSFREWIY